MIEKLIAGIFEIKTGFGRMGDCSFDVVWKGRLYILQNCGQRYVLSF